MASCSKEQAEPNLAQNGKPVPDAPTTQQDLKEAWSTFVTKVKKGEWKDAFGQYVSDDTWVEPDANGERASRPKKDVSNREFKRVITRAKNGDLTSLLIPIDEPCAGDAIDCGGGGGGGFPAPSYTFITTEMVQPYSSPPSAKTTGTAMRPTGFYTTENPNGYLFDLKIVKGRGQTQPSFYDKIYYHNIGANLNSGAGGEYIYVSFTRDPSAIIYHSNSTFGQGRDEREYSGVTQIHRPITHVRSEANRLGRPNAFYPTINGIDYSPMWAESPFPSVDSDKMKFPDLNDGAAGRFIYAFQSRSPIAGNPVEVGVLVSNSSAVKPSEPGWEKASGDLNEGAGGDFIYLYIKRR